MSRKGRGEVYGSLTAQPGEFNLTLLLLFRAIKGSLLLEPAA
jgi:hypothetical protein